MRGILMAVLFAAAACGCSQDAAPTPDAGGLRKVTLQLNWYPECEHGGYYAALVKGYYRDEGLDVEIVAGGPNTPVTQQVDAGKATFGVVNADDVLLGRAAGADLVAVMAPLQNSPRCILVHEESGIRSLDDLRDVTLAVGSRTTFFQYLKRRLPLSGVEVVAYSGSVAPFLDNPRYAQQGYVFSEPFLAKQAGAHPRSLMVSESGFNPYTSLLVTRGELVKSDPDLVRKMVRASVRGWRTYLESPAETNAEIERRNPEMNAAALQFGVEQLRPLCLPDNLPPERLGQMTAERWHALREQMIEAELLPHDAASADEAFTDRFMGEDGAGGSE